jgi:hypothetical protein
MIGSDSRSTSSEQGVRDNWLADEETFDWPAEPLFHNEPQALSGPEDMAEGDDTGARVQAAVDRYGPSRADAATIRRRRILAASVFGALIVIAVVVAVVATRSSNKSSTPPATNTPTQPTASTARTSSTGRLRPVVSQAQTAAPKTATLRVTLSDGQALKQGDSGAAVTKLQKALARLGFDVGTADGSFGSATQAAVKDFQQSNGLTADGVVGAGTAKKLNSALAAG